MTFEEFIASVESGEIVGRGLLTASLEHRTALRIAFDAGQSEKERCVDCDAKQGLERREYVTIEVPLEQAERVADYKQLSYLDNEAWRTACRAALGRRMICEECGA